MKSLFVIGTFLLVSTAPAMAIETNNCDAIKSEIEQRIINNGVPAANFSLTIIAASQLDQAQGKEVGHCGNNQFKIIYHKYAGD